MRILLLGRNGQVGWELNRSLLPLGEVIALDRTQADLSRPESLRKIVCDNHPDVIVNAAAYTAVDKAEEEEDLATVINSTAPGVLAEEADKSGALLIHYSTDYIFDGTKDRPYTEDDLPNPINAYGRSKLAGEQAIQATKADHLILRTSWVYAARGRNFLRTIMRLAKEMDELTIVGDQTGSPTWARLIAETTAHCLRQSVYERRKSVFSSGIYNVSSSGETSWYGFASAIVNNARDRPEEKIHVSNIVPIQTRDYPTPAKRPAYSCLATESLEENFNIVMPSWEYGLRLCMEELL
ncbi:dTDP-4-dehydrorhamnose reductase [Sulfuriflexus mobilis]|uniref:dTDP-4-dehydrorhamnose reductase n=1 Tax=Sulfuriflexus mobilis TaxID=1811807 RepID=UPI000F83D316|nr:dTDP-4-dehydrorhamnose reductase [Sulfuriflexus mobilis]